MAAILHESDLAPAADVPGFAHRLAECVEGIPPDAAQALTVIKPAAAARLWCLPRLFALGNVPDHPLCSGNVLDVYTWETPPDRVASLLAPAPISPDQPIYFACDMLDEGLATTWGFYLEHLAGRHIGSAIAAPPDVSWILVDWYGEFVTIFRTTFSRIREIAFIKNFPRHDGVPVPKPQYLIRFDDGSHWLSGDLRPGTALEDHHELMSFLAATADVTIAHLDVLPTEFVHRRQPRRR